MILGSSTFAQIELASNVYGDIVTPNTGRKSPDLTFRSNLSPYSLLNSMIYTQSAPDGYVLPVTQDEISNNILFRIYNNWDLNLNVADATNVRITTFDGALHTETKSVVSQEWIHIQENGYGENSSQPGIYTYQQDIDTAVGGANNFHVFGYGSNGVANNSVIRAGSNNNGLGFVEAVSYAELPQSVPNTTYSFSISIEYEWVN